MLTDDKNLKDSVKDISNMPVPYQATAVDIVFYNKINKLVTALYMVTDIMDTTEPLRGKLRTLGVEILSDIYSSSERELVKKVQEVLSFLGLASTIGMISEMNSSILKKEFLSLKQTLEERLGQQQGLSLMDLLKESPLEINKGQHTRIGVQKGSTLMKAISDKIHQPNSNPNFDLLKRQRREEIIKVVKDIIGGATIKDIKDKAIGTLASYGEKTLQRELVSMVKDHILYKTGSKRWSKYSVVV